MKSQVFNINDVEIFSAGTWNGDKYSIEDIEELARNFEETKKYLKPYLKLGHDDKQKLVQNDGLPSIGFIENVRRVGSKLLADFVNVPMKIYQLLEKKAYSRVSSEIYINFQDGAKKLGKVLKAVSLLGGDTPAVKNLDDILGLYSDNEEEAQYFKNFFASNGEAKAFECETVSVTFSAETNKSSQEESKMDEKEKLAMLEKRHAEIVAELETFKAKEKETVDSLKAKVESLEAENKTFKEKVATLEKENASYSEKFAEAKHEALKKDVEIKISELIENKKITPAMKEKAFALLLHAKEAVAEKKFTVSEKEVSMEELVVSLFNENSFELNTEERTRAGERQEKKIDDGSDADLKVKQYMEKHKVEFKDALFAVYPDGVPSSYKEAEA